MNNLINSKETRPKEYKIISFNDCRGKKDHDEILRLLESGVKVFIMLYNRKMLEITKADL
jgi:hypothetical protein